MFNVVDLLTMLIQMRHSG